MPRKAVKKAAAVKVGRRAAKAAGRPVAARKRLAEPVAPNRVDMCKLGKHPIARRIGSGCAECGSLTAWRG